MTDEIRNVSCKNIKPIEGYVLYKSEGAMSYYRVLNFVILNLATVPVGDPD